MNVVKSLLGKKTLSTSSPNLLPKNEKDQNDDSQYKIEPLLSLPPDCLRSIKSAKIGAIEAKEHFDVLCAVMLFEYKKRPDLRLLLEELLKRRRKERKEARRAARLVEKTKRREKRRERREWEKATEAVTTAAKEATSALQSSSNGQIADLASESTVSTTATETTTTEPTTTPTEVLDDASTTASAPLSEQTNGDKTSEKEASSSQKDKASNGEQKKKVRKTKMAQSFPLNNTVNNSEQQRKKKKKKKKNKATQPKKKDSSKDSKDSNSKDSKNSSEVVEEKVEKIEEGNTKQSDCNGDDKAKPVAEGSTETVKSESSNSSTNLSGITNGTTNDAEKGRPQSSPRPSSPSMSSLRFDDQLPALRTDKPSILSPRKHLPFLFKEKRNSFTSKTESPADGGEEEDSFLDRINKKKSKKKKLAEPMPLVPFTDDLLIAADPTKFYNSKNKIGHGGFGDVFTAKDLKRGGVVAIKILKKPFPGNEPMIQNEIAILKSCSHPNIVNYIESYLYHNKVWVIMEYCDGGTLHQLLSEVMLTDSQIAFICKEILSGLAYLHKQNRIHRDIKSDNVLLNINGSVKLADLGLCAEVKEEEKSKKLSVVGSRYWMAPEMIRREAYTAKVDIWSLASLCYEMVEGAPPYWQYKSLKAMFRVATRGAPPLRHPERRSELFLAFLGRCLEMDANKRASAEELLSHPFLEKACEKSKLAQSIEIVFLGNSLRMNGF